MKATYLILCIFLFAQGLFAQQPSKSYNNITDLLNGTYNTTLSVFVEKRTKNQNSCPEVVIIRSITETKKPTS